MSLSDVFSVSLGCVFLPDLPSFFGFILQKNKTFSLKKCFLLIRLKNYSNKREKWNAKPKKTTLAQMT